MGRIVPFPKPTSEPSPERESLEGLAGVIVVVQTDGLDLPEDSLRADVEAVLEEAGIATFDTVDDDAAGYAGYLGVTLQAATTDEHCGWTVRLELVQIVRLLRSSRRWLGVTWSCARTGAGRHDEMATELHRDLWDSIRLFARDFQEANAAAKVP